MTAATWREQAACRDIPTNTFFPLPADKAGAAEALAVCAGCPVVRPCLADALHTRDIEFGIRGGTAPEQRRALLDPPTPDPTVAKATRVRRELDRPPAPPGAPRINGLPDGVELHPCGTPSAFRRHRRRGEPECAPCRAAHNAYQRDQARARREASA